MALKPGAMWFDGLWEQPGGFDWRVTELYELIHSIDPACLVGNNHHHAPIDGEDFQMFEKDLPGENQGGFSAGAPISALLPVPGITLYAVTKAYLRSFGRSLSYELRPYGVGVTTVSPSAMNVWLPALIALLPGPLVQWIWKRFKTRMTGKGEGISQKIA